MDEIVLTEIFRRRKKVVNVKYYDKDKIRRQIPRIQADADKILRTKHKEFFNKGIEKVSKIDLDEHYEYEKYDKNDTGQYRTGSEFPILRWNLFDYPGANPRKILDDNDGKHPIYDAIDEIKKEMEETVLHKYPDFEISEEGDWDTGFLNVDLK